MVAALITRRTSRPSGSIWNICIYCMREIDDCWRQRVEAEHVPFPDAHVATLKSANSEVPCHEGTDSRRPGDDGIVIDSHGASPATLALLVLLLRVILELYSTRAKVTDGMI